MNQEATFEQSLGRLEEIVKKLESGNLPLEDAISIYQEGLQLSRVCSIKLEEAEGKVLKIVNKDLDIKEEFNINQAKEA